MDRRKLIETARRTLGRPYDNDRKISFTYLTHLRMWLERHPKEDNFRLGLDNGDGYITCGLCGTDLLKGDGDPEENGVDIFGAFENYEKHIVTPDHIARRRSGKVSRMANDLTPEVRSRRSLYQTQGSSVENATATQLHEKAPITQPPSASTLRTVDASKTAASRVEIDLTQDDDDEDEDDDIILVTKPSNPSNVRNEANNGAASRTQGRGRLGSTTTAGPSSRASAGRRESLEVESTVVHDIDSDFELAKRLQADFDAGRDMDVYFPYGVDVGMHGVQVSALHTEPSSSSHSRFMADSHQSDTNSEEFYLEQFRFALEKTPAELANVKLLYKSPDEVTARCLACHYSVDLPTVCHLNEGFDDMFLTLTFYREHLQSLHHQRAIGPAQTNLTSYREPTSMSRLSSPEPEQFPPSTSPYLSSPNPYRSQESGASSTSTLGKRRYTSVEDDQMFGVAGSSYGDRIGDRGVDVDTSGHSNSFVRASEMLDPYRGINRQLQLLGVQQQRQHQMGMQQGLGAGPSGASNNSYISPAAGTTVDAHVPHAQWSQTSAGINGGANGFMRSPQQPSPAFRDNRILAEWDMGNTYSYDGAGKAVHSGQIPQTNRLLGGEHDTFGVGPGARELGYRGTGLDAQRSFQEFMMKAVDEFKDVESVADARKELSVGSSDKIPGMSVRLLAHQLIGVSWMVKQEKDIDKKGGILADSMGLGKTVQMISTIVITQPEVPRAPQHEGFWKVVGEGKKRQVDNDIRRTTLVLAPASLLQQWYEEVLEKTEPNTLKVHIHHGKDKLRTVEDLKKYDVIITSYQTLVMDIPQLKKEKDKSGGPVDSDDGGNDTDEWGEDGRRVGVLGRMKWLRVAIDEAQNIRNKSTRISQAVAKLNSEYRWCLTGTPVTNSLADLYGFLRFCRFSPWDEWKTFNEQIAKSQKRNPTRAGQKAQAILKRHLLRRTKESTIDGKPILTLGPKTINIIELEFTPDERIMYESIETQHKKIVSKFFKEGTVMKNYTFILVMILRLRQLCGHPSLVLEKTGDGETIDNEENRRKEYDRAKRLMGEKDFGALLRRFIERAENRMKAEQENKDFEDDECAICYEPPATKRRVTLCGHEYCSDCIFELLRNHEGGEGEDKAQCPMCRKPLDRKDIFLGSAFEPLQEDLDRIYSEVVGDHPNKRQKVAEGVLELKLEDGRLVSAGNSKGKVSTRTEEMEIKRVEEEIAAKLGSDFEPSTKMTRMMELIQQWRKETPDDKIIIYSQWTSMLDLVEGHLKHCDVSSLRYDGKMSRMERVDVIAEFKKPEGPGVMLISLKCGGVGLNLTVANRVINLDLAWNFATEAQAYDRVHRLGQHKPVTVQRLAIKNTIEERIMKLQDQKQILSDAALGEGKVGKIQRMTAREIAQLFDLRVA